MQTQIKLQLLLFSLLLFSSTAFSQILEPVKWSFDANQLSAGEYELVYTATVDKGWTIYSQFTSDDGPVPTSINYDTKDGFELIGKAEESGHQKKGLDPFFDVEVIKYLSDEPFVIKQKVKLTGGDLKLVGYVESMACDDTKCLPPGGVDFEFDLKASAPNNIDKSKSESSEMAKTTEVLETQEPKVNSVASPAVSTTPTTTSTNSVASNDSKATAANTVSSTSLSPSKAPSPESTSPSDTGVSKTQMWTKLEKESHVEWEVSMSNTDDPEVYLISAKSNIDDGWATYSYYTEDGGPVPTEITIESPENIELVGKPIEEGKKKEALEPLFENINVIKYESGSGYVISQKVKLDQDDILRGYLTYMACDKTQCTMPTSLDFAFNTSGEFVGQEEVATTGNGSLVSMNGNEIDQIRPTIVTTYKEPIGDCGDSKTTDNSIFWMFIFGFGGGLLALLTPCVFPMIPLTVSFFTKDTKRKGWMNGLIYGASIVVIYVVMGLAITALFGEEALNRLSTNWIANTLFFVIFVLFAFSFFGFYEIQLPSSWANKSDKMADKGGIIGIFFMAFTLALVSFSCTGPIIGTAIVQAASNQVGPAIVMTGFALALAIPFGLFAIFPSWLNTLPKSGSWMSSVKVVLGFLELALALKFLSVADLTSHWGILKYEVFMGAWVIIGALMTLYLFGFIKFPHDSPIKKLSNTRKVFAVSSLILTLYLCTGFMKNQDTQGYKALSLMSGIAPPTNYNLWNPPPAVDVDIKSKYSSFSKCANNIDCFKDYYEGLAYAKEQKKPVLVDMTGHGCVNCRKTEDLIWVDPEIRSKLSEDFVLVSLYVDDDKELETTMVSKSRNKKIRNVGNKWADFQIVNFGQNSQPLYIMMTPDEEVMAPPRGFQEGIDNYNDYLSCGLKTFESITL